MNKVKKLEKARVLIQEVLDEMTEEEYDEVLDKGGQPGTAAIALGELIVACEEVYRPRITRAEINRRINVHGYELDRVNGYFYFRSLGEAPDLFDSIVHTVSNLQEQTYQQWCSCLVDKINETQYK